MKKLIAMLLALAMVFAMTACGTTENKETEPATEVTTEATEEVTEEVTEEIAEDEEPVMELSAMETLLNQIVEINPVEFMGMAAPVDLADADALFAELQGCVPSAQRIGVIREYQGGKRIFLIKD